MDLITSALATDEAVSKAVSEAREDLNVALEYYGNRLSFHEIFFESADGLSQTLAKLYAGGTKFYQHVLCNNFWDEVNYFSGEPVSVITDESMMGYKLVDTAPKLVFDDNYRLAQIIMSFDVVFSSDMVNYAQISMGITILRTFDIADMMFVEVNEKPLSV